ncbi:MAG: VOC family protein [Rhodospirillales bacterium]|nr:VOC family protein [Rhodospirillales bacterium]
MEASPASENPAVGPGFPDSRRRAIFLDGGGNLAFRILGIDHVVIRVRDMDAALRFYRDALGCREERRIEGIGLVQLRAGSSLIDLMPAEPQGAGRNVEHVALLVDDFDEAAIRGHLVRHGFPPGPVETRYGAAGQGPSMYVTDPDGNVIELKGRLS